MDKQNDDIKRNRPADKGRRNDPNVGEESAIQPGTHTISSSDTDDVNQHLTRTASDNFRTDLRDPKADPSFDEIDGPEDNDKA